MMAVWACSAFAQDASPAGTDKKNDAVQVPATTAADIKSNAVKKNDVKTEVDKTQPAKKMVQDATINLQTTITGNQEQPRVLYILPWQSPTAGSVDFESLDSEQKAVFGHIEREELRRELESSDEIK
jgi:hypothetical protein